MLIINYFNLGIMFSIQEFLSVTHFFCHFRSWVQILWIEKNIIMRENFTKNN